MNRTASLALAVLAVLGTAILPGVSAAQDEDPGAAAVVTSPSPNPETYEFAVQSTIVDDLWRKVRANSKCFGPGVTQLDVDNGGVPRSNENTSDALRNLLVTKLNAAFDAKFVNDPSGRRFDPPDDEKVILRDRVNGESFDPHPVVDRYRDRYLYTSADVTGTPQGQWLMSVSARGFGGCAAQSAIYLLPPEVTGRPVEPFDAIFGRLAARILQVVQRREIIFVYLSAEVAGEGTAPVSWTDSFVREAQIAIQAEVDRASPLSGEDKPIIKVRRRDEGATAEGAEPWPSDVVVERRQNTYHVYVKVDPPRRRDAVAEGLVSTEALPPMKMEELAPLSYAGATRSLGARVLSMGEDRRTLEARFSAAREAHEYGFQLDRSGVVEIGLRPDGDGEPPTIALFGLDGVPIEPNMPTQSPLLRRWRLDGPGIFRVKAENRAGANVGYLMTSRVADDAFQPVLGAGTRVTRSFQDWQSGVNEGDGRRGCFATTVSTGWSPAGWRPVRPSIWFSVEADPAPGTELELTQYFDLARFYHPDGDVVGYVTATAGGGWQLPLSEFDTLLQARQSNGLMQHDALEALTLGQSLRIAGFTADGQPAEVRYSLAGYQAAINEMLTNCGRQELRQALIRR
ncbi:hypothetical protein [Methylobrevis albus]|uniref:Uncharacterized protein n=1 Tax=Methylobrevis albus TaxID=2793297 RepID=A0A931I019_9HYPH|nr:hypothetical protein [Methylobrevis albus]MBH0236855.1 hypothetical protein [Methylobrevis albus]